MSDINYWDYEFTWSYLKALIEEFNEKWPTYYFYIEPFLDSEVIDIVGMFNDYGFYIFFHLDKSLPGRFRVEDKRVEHVLSVTLNPNSLIQKKEFEMLLIKESVDYIKKLKGDK